MSPDSQDCSKLRNLLQSHRGEHHVIVLQDFPDPDAIASGFAHQIICQSYDIETTILYCGRISHQQNLALVKLLGIDLVCFDPSLDLSFYKGAVFLDNQGTTTGPIAGKLQKDGVPVLIVVDHHELQNGPEPLYKDIRPQIGATCSIYTQYLQSGIIEMKKSEKAHAWMATALMHGIITDTNGFVRAQAEDFQAAQYLAQFRDADILAQIMNQARSKQTMKVIHQALGNRKIIESFCLSGVGHLRADNRDAIPQAADFLLTEENVHTAIVYGIVKGENWEESVVGSMRTNRLTIDPDQFIKEVFGKNASGQYFGGGKMSAGGFRIPTGFLSEGEDGEYQEHKWDIFNKQILYKILSKIDVVESKKREPEAGSQ